MKDSYEQRIQNQFGAFCVKVLKNEARYIQRELASLQSQEKSLGELTASELEQAAVWVARPGTSEHETALAVDIVDTAYQILDQQQEQTLLRQILSSCQRKSSFFRQSVLLRQVLPSPQQVLPSYRLEPQQEALPS